MESVRDTSHRAIERLLAAQPTTAAKVVFAFQVAAGAALARGGTAEWQADGTLRVRARSDAWLRELRAARPIIAERLSHLLGPNIVRKLLIESAAGRT